MREYEKGRRMEWRMKRRRREENGRRVGVGREEDSERSLHVLISIQSLYEFKMLGRARENQGYKKSKKG